MNQVPTEPLRFRLTADDVIAADQSRRIPIVGTQRVSSVSIEEGR